MKITLKRQPSNQSCTFGSIFVDGKFVCYSLEDIVRKEKIYGETAIPAGVYKVVITMSNRFKVDLPLLLNVPEYEGVRIHPGNVAADTHGCILPGMTIVNNTSIGQSRAAFNVLFPMIKNALDAGEEVYIDILNG